MKRWIKLPSPGQFRGEGEWVDLRTTGHDDEDWEYCQKTGYLPTHEGEEPPVE